MSKFNVGDEVSIRPESRYCIGTDTNPYSNVVGRVIHADTINHFGLTIQVQWPNDRTNRYRAGDLKWCPQPEDFLGVYATPDPEISAELQKLFFAHGIGWGYGHTKRVQLTDNPALVVVRVSGHITLKYSTSYEQSARRHTERSIPELLDKLS